MAMRTMGKSSRGGGWLRWLVMAGAAVGAGVVVARAGRRRRQGPDSTPSSRAPEPAGEEFWIPGPEGGLFVWRSSRRRPPLLLLVHGLGGSLGLWQPLLGYLEQGGRAMAAVDLRGHGRSDAPLAGGWLLPSLADDLAAVVEALGVRQVVAVGHALGAAVAAEYAVRRRPRVAGLVLVDPVGDPTRLPSGEREELAAAVRRDPHGELEWIFRQLLLGAREETAARVLGALRATPPATLVGLLDASLEYDPVPAVEAWKGPVLCLSSTLNALPHSLPRRLPGLPNRVLAEASHWLMLDRPATVAEGLEDFLRSLT